MISLLVFGFDCHLARSAIRCNDAAYHMCARLTGEYRTSDDPVVTLVSAYGLAIMQRSATMKSCGISWRNACFAVRPTQRRLPLTSAVPCLAWSRANAGCLMPSHTSC